eukprot:Rhum_TRINITY_DN18627_c0_g1::Rhum_TRINITY_DN18627_c0_g1_i1::g.167921::m.167921
MRVLLNRKKQLLPPCPQRLELSAEPQVVSRNQPRRVLGVAQAHVVRRRSHVPQKRRQLDALCLLKGPAPTHPRLARHSKRANDARLHSLVRGSITCSLVRLLRRNRSEVVLHARLHLEQNLVEQVRRAAGCGRHGVLVCAHERDACIRRLRVDCVEPRQQTPLVCLAQLTLLPGRVQPPHQAVHRPRRQQLAQRAPVRLPTRKVAHLQYEVLIRTLSVEAEPVPRHVDARRRRHLRQLLVEEVGVALFPAPGKTRLPDALAAHQNHLVLPQKLRRQPLHVLPRRRKQRRVDIVLRRRQEVRRCGATAAAATACRGGGGRGRLGGGAGG